MSNQCPFTGAFDINECVYLCENGCCESLDTAGGNSDAWCFQQIVIGVDYARGKDQTVIAGQRGAGKTPVIIVGTAEEDKSRSGLQDLINNGQFLVSMESRMKLIINDFEDYLYNDIPDKPTKLSAETFKPRKGFFQNGGR